MEQQNSGWRRGNFRLGPAATKAGLAVLVPHHQTPQSVLVCTVDDRIPKHSQGKPPPTRRRWCADLRVGGQQLGRPFKFVQKAAGKRRPGVAQVEVDRVGQILFGTGVQRALHRRKLARSRASAASAGTATVAPLSRSASR